MEGSDKDLVLRIADLGIDQSSYRALALRPLVEVAWADGTIQKAERDLIVKVARENYFDMGNGAEILHGWLTTKPTEEYFDRGRALLVTLAQRERGMGADLDGQTLGALLDLCEDVAKAAGGLFGMAFTVENRERLAIREISSALSLTPNIDWSLT